MGEKFNRKIESEFSYIFKVNADGNYALTIKASCRPGWGNRWWLKIKDVIKDILNLHLDDDDLRLEIDGIVFKKPGGKRGLYNSPAAFSGTKILGKTKTVILVISLSEGEHTIRFIPDGAPYLESVFIEPIGNQNNFSGYFNLQAEKENFYSWHTSVFVESVLNHFTLTAKADILVNSSDDDDLKMIIDGEVQENKDSRHTKSFFCGSSLKGREKTFDKKLNLARGTHYIELFADNQPILISFSASFGGETTFVPNDPRVKKEEFNPLYVIKDSAFANSNSLNEEEIEDFLKRYGERYPNHIYHKNIEGKQLSFWIKKFTFESRINPKIILAKLQAEKGLIVGETSIEPSQNQLNWALGAGSLDTGNIDNFGGLFTQIKKSPGLLEGYLLDIDAPPFIHNNVDGKPLTVINKSTLVLYRYTPHLDGINLFYRVYSQFFGNDDLGGET